MAFRGRRDNPHPQVFSGGLPDELYVKGDPTGLVFIPLVGGPNAGSYTSYLRDEVPEVVTAFLGWDGRHGREEVRSLYRLVGDPLRDGYYEFVACECHL